MLFVTAHLANLYFIHVRKKEKYKNKITVTKCLVKPNFLVGGSHATKRIPKRTVKSSYQTGLYENFGFSSDVFPRGLRFSRILCSNGNVRSSKVAVATATGN